MIYDILIIGAGPSGLIAAQNLSEKFKVLLIDKGKNLHRKKDFICGWFGNGISELARVENTDKEILKTLKKIAKQKILQRCCVANFTHESSLKIAEYFYDDLKNKIDISLDNEALNIIQKEDFFEIKTEKKEIKSKKIIIATGRFSLDFINKIKFLETKKEDSFIGVRVEFPLTKTKNYLEKFKGLDFNKDNYYFLDFRYNTMVSEWEDSNLISAFGHCLEENTRRANIFVGIKQSIEDCIRNAKIINVLNNDKIKKELAKDFLSNKSITNNIVCFDEVKEALFVLNREIKDIIEYSNIYIPEIRLNGILNVDETMKTNIPNLYGIGSCTNLVKNIFDSINSGFVVTDTILNQ